MFTKDRIIILDFNMFNSMLSEMNFDTQINDLYSLLFQIITELNITSLSKVIIVDFSYSKTTNGKTSYNLGNNIMSSQVEFDKRVFVNFNNAQNIELKNEALEVIYHELYHVYNEENLFYKFAHKKIPIEDSPYCRIGAKCWAEYLSYYKTQGFHMSDYPFKEFDIIYNRIKQEKPKAEVINGFFYMLSNICAYESDKEYIKKLEDITYFKNVRVDSRYIAITKELDNIMKCYPDNIVGVEIFTNLGKIFCELIKYFHYEITFINGVMIIS